jgi:hypothetical protein
MRVETFVLVMACSFLTASCVSSKKYKSLNATYGGSQAELSKCRTDNSSLIGAEW